MHFRSVEDFFTHLWLLRCALAIVLLCFKTKADQSLALTPAAESGNWPHWSPVTKSLYYVDSVGFTINRYVPATGEFYSTTLIEHQKVGFMVPIDGVDNGFAIGNGPSVGFYTWDGVSSDPLVARAFMTTGQDEFNVNSGKADEKGRLWVGLESGTLLSAGVDEKSLTERIRGKYTPRGMTWSRFGSKLYRSDYSGTAVYQHDYNVETGVIEPNGSVYLDLVALNINLGPGGMAVDKTGDLWIACPGTGQILRFNYKTGKRMEGFLVHSAVVTSIAFGGPNLDELYVTTSKQVGSGFEDSGSLFKITGPNLKGLEAMATKVNL